MLIIKHLFFLQASFHRPSDSQPSMVFGSLVFYSGHSKSITHSSKYQNCQAFSGAMPSQTSFFLFF